MSNPATPRYHGLDSLRGFAMMLGVALHAALSFLVTPAPFWPVFDTQRSLVFEVFVYATHAFRMQTFFLLGGFFAALLLERDGHGPFIRHRLVRIGVPLVAALLLVQPSLQVLWLVAEVHEQRGTPIGSVAVRGPFAFFPGAGERPGSATAIAWEHLASGAFLLGIRPLHLWFLIYLLACYLLWLPLDAVLRRTGTDWLRPAFGSPWRLLLLAPATVLLLWPMRVWLPDTPGHWLPEAGILGYYFFFFVVGVALYRQRDLLAGFERGWLPALLVANLLVLPPLLGLTAVGVRALLERAPLAATPTFVWLKLAALVLQAVYTWLMLGGLLGAFQAWFREPRPWARWLADSSYWCYLLSLTPIILLQMLVAAWPVPALLKFALVTAGSLLVLLVSYQWLVRYTLLGALLHGWRKRPAHAPGERGASAP